ncbi:MAG: hypothetical protein OES09_03960 [Gammaproteobacteria bacterium]|nr:hypothetical protein [Gammaproteobacteria bacterium]
METNEAKAEAEDLINAVLPVAQQMLEKYGEFIPYGGAMKPNGEVVSVPGYDGNEQPSSQEIINLLKDSFRAAGKNGEYKATAIVFDVHVIAPGSDEKTDAVAVALDHKEGYSVVVLFPYQLSDGAVEFGQVFAEAGDNDIFVH